MVRIIRIAGDAATAWLVSLPILSLGMGCFWLQRDAQGALRGALTAAAIIAVLAPLALPGLLCALRGGGRSFGSLAAATGKALLVAVPCLLVASLLSAVKVLRPEEVSLFGQQFASAHAYAAAIPSFLALCAAGYTTWISGSPRRIVWIAGEFVIAVVGVLTWQWSAGVGYDAIRFSNADEIVLMAQTVTLSGLLLACVVDAFLCRPSVLEG